MSEAVLGRLHALADPGRLAGMARSGIGGGTAIGVTVAELRALARGVGRPHAPAPRARAGELGRSHALAQELWDSGVHEARILASLVDERDRVEEAQLDRWVADL